MEWIFQYFPWRFWASPLYTYISRITINNTIVLTTSFTYFQIINFKRHYLPFTSIGPILTGWDKVVLNLRLGLILGPISNLKQVLSGVCFFGFLLKAIYFQNLGCLFFYFFMTYYKLFTKWKKQYVDFFVLFLLFNV